LGVWAFFSNIFNFNALFLSGKKIPMNHTAAAADCRLYPTVHMRHSLLEFNFGGDKARPFKYDIGKCPGLELQWSWRWKIKYLNERWNLTNVKI
jgi:hypothetical protein